MANCVEKLPTCLAEVEQNSGRMFTATVKLQDSTSKWNIDGRRAPPRRKGRRANLGFEVCQGALIPVAAQQATEQPALGECVGRHIFVLERDNRRQRDVNIPIDNRYDGAAKAPRGISGRRPQAGR